MYKQIKKRSDGKKILWFSCGVTSAVACKLALEKYGKENCLLAYIKIDSAHPDNNRFIKDCENWYGMPIEVFRSEKYKDQYDVIEKTKYVNGVGGARCTLELKKKVALGLLFLIAPNTTKPPTRKAHYLCCLLATVPFLKWMN